MTEPIDFPGGGLPPDLAAVDAELASIRYEERPSFGPELEAELGRTWAALQTDQGGGSRRLRQLAAAGLAGLLVVSVGVPSARAAIVKLVDALQTVEPVVVAAPPEDPVTQIAVMEPEPEAAAAPPAEEPAPSEVERVPMPVHSGAVEVRAPTVPELVDRPLTERLIQRHYPMDLQNAGIGGTVRLQLWIEASGKVDYPTVTTSSGVAHLDRAAIEAAPSFRFIPATRDGVAVGTWAQFDVLFEASATDRLPRVEPLSAPNVALALEAGPPPEWGTDPTLPSPGHRNAGELLGDALGEEVVDRLGPLRAILAGDPPAGVGPTTWRVAVSRELDRAAARHPDNPAPLLALARIRRKQGLRTDAQILVERGLQRAIRGEAGVGPGLLAELHYERGTLVKERWLGSWRLGRVSSGALPPSLCPQARSSGGAASGFASVERLIAWNYLCPAELDAILARDFQPTTEGMAEHAVMGASFQRAVEAEPGHVGANVEILLALADEGRWSDVLHGAERFWEISGGHPYADLVGGVALQRLARSDEAYERFERALERLPDERADRLCGVAPLLIDRQAGEYRALSGDERRVWESRFWAALDPIAATQVNERKVEHLARAAYAELRLGGVDTDAGRVWVRYGRPESVRVIGESAVRTEFWDYGGAGPDVTFRRVASSQALALTPEGHAYVDELREAFPHRYGTDARVVTPLEGQVTRFRGDDLGTTHLRIRSRVPDELATGGADALDLGVYVVRGQGRVEERWRSAISAAVAPIELVATAPADARTVTVEVYNRHTGRAASLVAPARLSATDGAPYLSDLMLVRAADPSPRELFWDRAWVAPLDLGRPHEAARLGTLFEVYELPPEVSWYRVRAELRSADSEVRALAIRPAGGTEFRTEWDRRPPAELAGPEYFTVDVADVRPGRYTLRLVLEIPGGGAPLTAERSLELRGS